MIQHHASLRNLLAQYRDSARSEREKGNYFERLAVDFIKNDPGMAQEYEDAWLFSEWAATHDMDGRDTGIDAVARSLVVEPRLSSATRWYVTADPGEIDGLEFAYLSGNEGPQVESRSGWDVDGVEIRVILDFGAGFIDHRGWFQNAGA